mgnify:CR=1 FL=1
MAAEEDRGAMTLFRLAKSSDCPDEVPPQAGMRDTPRARVKRLLLLAAGTVFLGLGIACLLYTSPSPRD